MQDNEAREQTQKWGAIIPATAVEGFLRVAVHELKVSAIQRIEHCGGKCGMQDIN